MDKFVLWIVLGTVVLLGGLVWVSSQDPTKQPPLGQEVEVLGRDHIPRGSEHPAYNSNPPTSGWHDAEAAAEKIYPEPILDEQAIHSLEHGRVWVTYRPENVDEATRGELESVVRPFLSKALLSPRPANDHALAAVSWGRIQTWEAWNDQSKTELKEFLERNRDRGPERVP